MDAIKIARKNFEFVMQEHGATIQAIEPYGEGNAVLAMLHGCGGEKRWLCGYAVISDPRAKAVDTDEVHPRMPREITYDGETDGARIVGFHCAGLDVSVEDVLRMARRTVDVMVSSPHGDPNVAS